ncbi:adenosine deaminase [Actinokineospora bangkokensis]|uniref:Adenosine deaminase n=1 Tax=Actinokineospora bangkokensis TaxID=1193682 RepID=A0A1Q9LER2_9PSEU|nr:adenosine deaminase [Actinokineospora bangkokensis]OLR90508.1 adenosine deaminase [Actinokineospora bangkokensis]
MSTAAAPVTPAALLRVPKVLLHDHLDGGLRPATVVELAAARGHALPTTDPDALGAWFRESADSGSLERYLETFAHTLAVMQDEAALARVAAECAEDLAADGVVYAEVRYAPELFTERGLDLDAVVATVQAGFAEGVRRAAAAGRSIRIGTLLCAMRQNDRALEVAELVVRHRGEGVVGFDIAGPEAGYPPSRYLPAFALLRGANAHYTIHAGEAFGLPSIQEAIQHCGTERLGHGVRIADDIEVGADGRARLGTLAAYVRDRRIPLELCPSSNLQTGAAASIAEHPFGLLAEQRFRVTVNTDNRLMSACSMTSEMQALVDAFGYGWDDLRRFTVNAMESAFIGWDERLELIEKVIEPGYAAAAAG